MKSYVIAWNTYRKFLASCPGAVTGDVRHILAFVSYCHTQLALAYNTIKLYLAGVQHFLSLEDPSKPSVFTAHAVKSLLRGIQKLRPVTSGIRLPITSAIFRDMSEILTRSPFGALPSLVIQAAIYLAFYGFLRPGEFTVSGPSSHTLLRRHLTRSQNHYTLRLLVSKTQQTGPGVDILLFQTNNAWCPVTVLDRLLSQLPDQSQNSPLLPFLTSPLSSSQFIKHIRILLSNLGFNPSHFSGHSFRIGAASAASQHGVPEHVIKKLGRWKSACFATYIPNPQEEMAQAFSVLAQ